MEKQNLTEEDSKQLIDLWKKEAKEVKTPDELALFVTKLITQYNHDYGTVVRAMTAAMMASFSVVDKSPQGGITGFQAGFIAWDMIKEFMSIQGAAKILDYDNLLYPQYAHKFEKTIDVGTWESVQAKARENLTGNNDHTHHDVVSHWKSIVDGVLPFGFTITQE